MSLSAGSRLGPYEIISAIGAGGMGEVYRAHDTRLDRTVAIKILPDHSADRSELRERFEREARTIASLNHPHICTLHDIGHQDGTDFLVMEYLEGETLAQRLTKGPLPLEQVLQYAIQIADALDKARRTGVTHRDLKPGNIMLTKSGAKLLDFGLAKLRQEASPPEAVSQLPTVSQPITAQGTIVGTLQYMAPEQLEGREADARTDIFAFGAVAYEMVTGKKAFEGKSQASVVAKILEIDPPPISSLQPMTPPALDHIVKRCLAKEPDERWQAASDLCNELRWIAEGGSQVAPLQPVPPKGIRALGRRPFTFALGTLLLGALIAGVVTWKLKPAPPPPPRPVVRYAIPLPTGTQLAGLFQPAVAISPDGSQLIYVASQGGTQRLYLRTMDNPDSKPIPDTEGASNPFFSPDGKWLGFFAEGKLKKILVSGGAAVTLAYTHIALGASWSSQGTIVLGSLAGPLWQVPDTGGTPQPLTQLENGEVSQRFPQFLPGGKALLFESSGGAAVYSLETGERRSLVRGATYPRYISSGHLLYMQGETLMAAPFDPRRLMVTGAAVPVLEGVPRSGSGSAQYSTSSTGSLVYISGSPLMTESRPVWVGRAGVEQPLAAPLRRYGFPRLSPDDRSIALVSDSQIWLFDLNRESLSRFTADGGTQPTWTPDGKRIAYAANKGGQFNVFWQQIDGSGGPERLATSKYPALPMSFSSDGKLLAFTEDRPPVGLETLVLQMKDRETRPLSQAPVLQDAPRFSPDGHWLAYVSGDSGRIDVYVQPYPGPGGKYQISTEGGSQPVWNPNGKELFYRNGDQMLVVNIRTQPSFVAGKPRQLFARGYVSSSPAIPDYDVSRDGKRFLMLKAAGKTQAPTQINVVLNWTEELKRLVPAANK